jgi:hypothetical protein
MPKDVNSHIKRQIGDLVHILRDRGMMEFETILGGAPPIRMPPIKPLQYSRGCATADSHAASLGYFVTRLLGRV